MRADARSGVTGGAPAEVVSARPERLRELASTAAGVFDVLVAAAGTLAETLDAYASTNGPEWRAEVGHLSGAIDDWAANVASLGAWTGTVADALVAADAEGAAGIHATPEARLRSLLPCDTQPVLDGTRPLDTLDLRLLGGTAHPGDPAGRLYDIATAPADQRPEPLINVPADQRPEPLINVPADQRPEPLINVPAPGGVEVLINTGGAQLVERLINTPTPRWLDDLVARQHAETPETEERPPLRTPEDVFDDPETLRGRTLDEVIATFDDDPNWEAETMRQGRNRGRGLVLREYTYSGGTTGRLVLWHPGGGHHGPEPYWKVSSGAGTVRVPA